MTADLARLREQLVQRWLAIPDFPAADQVPDLVRLAEQLVHLIGWIDDHRGTTRAEYRAELARIRADGIAWPEPIALPAPHEPDHGDAR